MKAKPFLLSLLLPTLLLASCSPSQAEESASSEEDSSSSEEASSSESSTSSSSSSSSFDWIDTSIFEADEATWKAAFSNITSFMAFYTETSDDLSVYHYASFSSSLIRLVKRERKKGELTFKLSSDLYLSKSEDGTYDQYAYDEEKDGYLKTSLAEAPSCFEEKDAYCEMLSNSYALFSSAANGLAYQASFLTYLRGSKLYYAKDVLANFALNELYSLVITPCKLDGTALYGSLAITGINNTNVTLPSGDDLIEA